MRQQGVGKSANMLGRHSVGSSAIQPKLKFADGGRPPVGRLSIVGERGPELFMPDRAGTIIPNHAMGSTNVIVNVDASGSTVEGDEEQGRELGRLISVAVQSEIIQQKRPGGLLA
jgi:phage-related minor tail protein